MIAHGFVSGAMFLSIGVLYDRVHSREIACLWWRRQHHAQLHCVCIAFAMANCGLPGTPVLWASGW